MKIREKGKDKKKKVLVVAPGNPDFRIFCANFRISENIMQGVWFPLRGNSENLLAEMGPRGRQLLEKLSEIPGIVGVSIRLEEFSVEIRRSFTWDDLVPDILDVIQEVFGQQEKIEIEEEDQKRY